MKELLCILIFGYAGFLSGKFVVLGDESGAASAEPAWCSLLGNQLCTAAGDLRVSFASSCPVTCGSSEPADHALAEKLKSNLTVEFRTGFVLPEPETNGVADSLQKGWRAWLSFTGADTVGFPAGGKFVLINHTSIFMPPDKQDCDAYVEAARELMERHQIQAAIITNNFCKTELSQAYHSGGVLHFIQSGTPMALSDGSQYLNKHSWFLHIDSNEYPQLFLKSQALKGHRRVALLSRASHPWTKSSAQFVADNYISMYKMEIVYSDSWLDGGGSLSGSTDEYVELYNTTQWDKMLMGAAQAGADVLVVYCIGEGVSIMKRMKTLGINFEGVFMSVSPTRVDWSTFLGTDGDYVIAPAQWDAMADSACDVFGSTSTYASVYKSLTNQDPDYHSATMSAAGVVLQLAIQTENSTDTNTLLSVISTMSRDTLFGRVRFSYRQRNFGRPPVALQHQDAEMRVVYPEIMAQYSALPFVNWECRDFLQPKGQSCIPESLLLLEGCTSKYPGMISSAACDLPQANSTEGMMLTIILISCGAGVAVLAGIIAGILCVRHRARQAQKDLEHAAKMRGTSIVRDLSSSESSKQQSSYNITYSGRGLASLNRHVSKPKLEVEVEDILGKGAGGVVYKGTWQGVPVALKVCRVAAKDETQSADPQELFTMETGIGEALRHPNVVQLFGSEVVPVMKLQPENADGASCQNGSSAMSANVSPKFKDGMDRSTPDADNGHEVMMWEAHIIQEYCMHGDLRHALKNGRIDGQTLNEDGKYTPPTIGVALQLALDAAYGMAYIHSMNIIHGDFKASNILLTNREVSSESQDCTLIAKVSDFGLALVMDNDTSHVSGVFTGTITHMAPECIQDGRQSYAADVYAFGIMLYEIISARGAYSNKSSIWIIDQVVNKRRRPVFPQGTPVSILELFTACTEHEPEQRPTMGAVVEWMEDLLESFSSIKIQSRKRIVSQASSRSLNSQTRSTSQRLRSQRSASSSRELQDNISSPVEAPQSNLQHPILFDDDLDNDENDTTLIFQMAGLAEVEIGVGNSNGTLQQQHSNGKSSPDDNRS